MKFDYLCKSPMESVMSKVPNMASKWFDHLRRVEGMDIYAHKEKFLVYIVWPIL